MKKIMKVRLTIKEEATPEKGYSCLRREWDIPFDSTGESRVMSALEIEMKLATASAFHELLRPAVSALMYGHMASGGVFETGGVKIEVSFHRDTSGDFQAPAGMRLL